jgi:hypothetical protein
MFEHCSVLPLELGPLLRQWAIYWPPKREFAAGLRRQIPSRYRDGSDEHDASVTLAEPGDEIVDRRNQRRIVAIIQVAAGRIHERIRALNQVIASARSGRWAAQSPCRPGAGLAQASETVVRGNRWRQPVGEIGKPASPRCANFAIPAPSPC